MKHVHVPLAGQQDDAASAACCVPNKARADSKQTCCAWAVL